MSVNKSKANAATRKWYGTHKGHVRKKQREYENTPQGWIVRQVAAIRYRAKANNWEFDLDTEYLKSLMVSHCPALGYELAYSILPGNNYKKRREAASVDRIDSTKGYVRGNVQIISWQANLMKQNATVQELELFAHWVLQTKENP